MDPFIDPLAIAMISQLRQNTEQEELECTPDEKSTWQMIREAGVRLATLFGRAREIHSPAKNEAYSLEVNTNQFDQNEVCM
jgi:hypothetical protein